MVASLSKDDEIDVLMLSEVNAATIWNVMRHVAHCKCLMCLVGGEDGVYGIRVSLQS